MFVHELCLHLGAAVGQQLGAHPQPGVSSPASVSRLFTIAMARLPVVECNRMTG